MRRSFPRARAGVSVCLVAVLLAVWAGATVAADAAPELTPDAFAARLESARRIARQGITAPSRSAMERVRRALGLPVIVTLPGGDVSFRTDPALDSLEGNRGEDFERADRHLAALARQLRLAAAGAAVDPTRLAGALRESYDGVSRVDPSLSDRVFAFIVAAIRRLFDLLFRSRGPATVLGWAVVAALIGLGALLLRRLGLTRERITPGAGIRRPETIDWSKRADEALRRGDLVDAVRALYRVLLAALSARGTVSDSPSLTAGECRRAVAESRPALYPVIAEATLVFERVMYGHLRPTEDHVRILRQAERSARAT